jgi:hypothetical protein
MSAEIETIIEKLQADEDRYREKHGFWKGAYYAAILTVSGILIAATEVSNSGPYVITKVMESIILVGCLVAIGCVLIVMRQFIQLYYLLGYQNTIREEKDIQNARQRMTNAFEGFQRKGKMRQRLDCAIGIGFAISLIFSVALVPLGWMGEMDAGLPDDQRATEE